MKPTTLRKLALRLLGAIALLALAVYLSFTSSPWPAVLLIRYVFADGAAQHRTENAALVPAGVSVQRALSYAPGDPDALFDVFSPADAQAPLPALVWVHGGGFVAGTRDDLSEYLQIVAARGFVTFAIDYSTAPGARFPTPVRQTNQALAHLAANALRFNLDPERIFLGGDSAGAQITAQTALVISDASQAQQLAIEPGLPRAALRGLVLFCGPYDPQALDFDGGFGGFMRTVIWSYVGTRDPRDWRVARLSVTPHVSAAYPPAFISVGNADPLAPQSLAFAEALRAQGTEVDALFFAPDHQPPLAHEYQLELTTDAGRLALERTIAFLNARSK